VKKTFNNWKNSDGIRPYGKESETWRPYHEQLCVTAQKEARHDVVMSPPQSETLPAASPGAELTFSCDQLQTTTNAAKLRDTTTGDCIFQTKASSINNVCLNQC